MVLYPGPGPLSMSGWLYFVTGKFWRIYKREGLARAGFRTIQRRKTDRFNMFGENHIAPCVGKDMFGNK